MTSFRRALQNSQDNIYSYSCFFLLLPPPPGIDPLHPLLVAVEPILSFPCSPRLKALVTQLE